MSARRWIVGAGWLGALWNLAGVANYLAHVGVFGQPGPAMPTAITAAFAIGTFVGVIGSAGLGLLRRWSRPLLWVSFTAVVVNWGWVLVHSAAASVPLGVSVIGVAALLLVLAELAARKALLR